MLPKYVPCFRICYCEFEVKASLHLPKLLKSLFALTENGSYVQFVKKSHTKRIIFSFEK